MFTVQFKDGDWQEHVKRKSLDVAKRDMKRGIKDNSTGPWRIIDENGTVMDKWPS